MNKKNTINIFIVEDNKVFLLALRADIELAFANLPLRINTFDTGEACMAKFKEEQPDIVILDYNLNSKDPNASDGIKVLDWIKREKEETDVIILTSDDSLDIALKSFHHGAADYVVKTETKFKKINAALFNMIKMIRVKSEARKYKYIVTVLFICVLLLVGGVIAIQIIKPGLLR